MGTDNIHLLSRSYMTIYVSSPITFQEKAASSELPPLFLSLPQQFVVVDCLAPLTLQAASYLLTVTPASLCSRTQAGRANSLVPSLLDSLSYPPFSCADCQAPLSKLLLCKCYSVPDQLFITIANNSIDQSEKW